GRPRRRARRPARRRRGVVAVAAAGRGRHAGPWRPGAPRARPRPDRAPPASAPTGDGDHAGVVACVLRGPPGRAGGPRRRRPWPPRSPARPWGRALALEGLVVFVVFQLLTVVFLAALRSAGESFYDDVLLGFFGPEKHGLARRRCGGLLPVWLDNQYGGEPVLANLQHAVLYPGNLPFWVLPTSTALEVVAA